MENFGVDKFSEFSAKQDLKSNRVEYDGNLNNKRFSTFVGFYFALIKTSTYGFEQFFVDTNSHSFV